MKRWLQREAIPFLAIIAIIVICVLLGDLVHDVIVGR